MPSFLSKRFVLRLLRDLTLLFAIVSLVELWQARHLPKGAMPIALAELPYLTPAPPARARGESLTLLYVFAPWCGVCRTSAPNLKRLERFGVSVEALALSWENEARVREFVTQTELGVPVRLGQDRESDALRITAYPTYFLIHAEGEIVNAWTGYTTTLGLFWKVVLANLLS